MKITGTPWGKPDQQTVIAEGIVKVYTPSHGGIWLSQARRDSMPDQYRDIPTFAGGNWYEEDCDWAIVDATGIQNACDTLKWLRANSNRFQNDAEQINAQIVRDEVRNEMPRHA